MSLLQDIEDLLLEIWKSIKKTFVRLLNFLRNIVGWFRSKDRIKKVQSDKRRIADAIKVHWEEKNYVVVNIFNTETNTIEEAEALEYEELDQETKAQFRDKEMIVLT